MEKAKVFLDTFYNCESSQDNPVQRTFQHINCKHWSVNKQTCTTFCVLKIYDSPTALNCAKCHKRDAIVGITINNESVLSEPNLIKKTLNYTKAESSQFINGKVSEKVFNKRKEICMDCSYRTNPKPESEPIGWCKGGCGCVIGNPRAALSQKLYMPNITCPKQKWDADTGQGFTITDAIDSLKGIKDSIQSLFKKDK